MVITLDGELEAALNELARRQGLAPEVLALKALRERFVAAAALQPRDEWERGLLAAARDCGVSLPDSAFVQRRTVRLVAYLIDTTILGRLANAADAQHAAAARAALELHRRG